MKSDSERPFLFIPIEIVKRELYGKLYLALSAVDRGYKVLIGDPKRLKVFMNFFTPGVYFSKDLYKARLRDFEKLKKHGDYIVAWDEEGLVFTAKRTYVLRMSEGTVKAADIIFTWGNYQKRLIEDAFSEHNSIVSVGNPRMDLLREKNQLFFSKEAAEIKEKHGAFILINSSFSHCNSFLSKGQLKERMDKFFSSRDPVKKKDFELQYKLEEERYVSFIELIKFLSKNHSNMKIVVRPHPVEDPSIWEEDVGYLPNVIISNEGNVIPWCMASSVVIHNSCTTGIEAFLLGKKVIVYDKVGRDYWDFNLPNSLGIVCSNMQEVENAIFHANGSDSQLTQGSKILKDHLESYNGVEATEAILNAIDDLVIGKCKKAKIIQKVKLYAWKIPRLVLYEFLFFLRYRNDPMRKMDRNKLGMIRMNEVKRLARRMQFKNLKFRLIPFNLFYIEKASVSKKTL